MKPRQAGLPRTSAAAIAASLLLSTTAAAEVGAGGPVRLRIAKPVHLKPVLRARVFSDDEADHRYVLRPRLMIAGKTYATLKTLRGTASERGHAVSIRIRASQRRAVHRAASSHPGKHVLLDVRLTTTDVGSTDRLQIWVHL